MLPPAEEKAAKICSELIKEIVNTLSHTSELTTKDKLMKLYHHLGIAAKYPGDTGISESFRNALAMVLTKPKK